MMMSRKAVAVAKHENKFTKYVKAPFRILSRAKDFYVRALTDCSGRMSYGGAGTGPFNNNMPRSFSVTSSSASNHDDEDLRELIRAASQRGQVEKLELEIRRQRQVANNKLPRSSTVGIGRIDEEKPYEFEDDFKADNDLFYPRSRSHAVPKKNRYAL